MSKDTERAAEAWESYLSEQKLIIGMPGLMARPSFLAGYRAALAQEGQAVPDVYAAVHAALKKDLGAKYCEPTSKPNYDWLSPMSVDRADLEADAAPQSVPAQPVANERKYTPSEMESFGKAYADARDKRRASTDRKALSMEGEPSVVGGAFAAPPAAEQDVPRALTDEQREAVRDAIAEALGDAYDCTRVWSAWGYGTMGPGDFAMVSEDVCRLDEITDAAIAALTAAGAK